MEGFNKKASMQNPPSPPHVGLRIGSNNNSPNIALQPPSHEISGNSSGDKGKGLALPSETSQEHNSETLVGDVLHAEPSEMDRKKLKKKLANRVYSNRYRQKQNLYVAELEAKVKALQAAIAISIPRLEFADRRNKLLRAENKAMRDKLSACSGELMFKQAQYEVLRKEIESLMQLYQVTCQRAAAEALNLGLNQPGLNHFKGPAGPVKTLMPLNQFEAGQSSKGHDMKDSDKKKPGGSSTYKFM